MDRDLHALYRERCATPSDIYMHLPRLVELVEQTNAAHVIELGVRAGNSTVAFLYGLERTGGTLTSVDVSEAPDIGTWAHWRFIHGDDLDDRVLEQLDEADILFIDTTHTYDQTLAELCAYHRLVRKGGLIVLHDTELRIGQSKPVTEAIRTFCAAREVTWVNEPINNGLGVIQL